MRCQDFKEIMDSYLGDELLVETNHEVLRHLENCPACRGELAARRRLLAQMRSAIKRVPEARLDPAFAVRLQKDLRNSWLRRPALWKKLQFKNLPDSPVWAATIAACLLIGILLGVFLLKRSASPESVLNIRPDQTNSNGTAPRLPESTTAEAVKIAFREMAQTAVGDHKNCAVKFHLAEKPVTLTEAAEKYGPFYKDLDKAVIESIREVSAKKISEDKTIGDIEFLEAHSCVFGGRRFAHVVLRKDKKLISLLVTEDNLFDKSDMPITAQNDEDVQVAGSGAARYAVFVVSDLSEAENLTIAEILIPAVRRHIGKAEA